MLLKQSSRSLDRHEVAVSDGEIVSLGGPAQVLHRHDL
ncbi:MAG: hypothetical protein EB039_14935, partial [Proteobacteria bacterium]|nr:hypothetical protein [Pseudomonadota bacterium]